MTLNIFYSWQSDSPGRTNRHFLEHVLLRAAELATADTGVDVEIDHSTQGIMGAPPIAETIIAKIKEADVFVADCTLVGSVFEGGKKLLNSNVAIELGHAISELSHESLLQLMNNHYGQLNELPFDMAHRRGPIQYTLAPNTPRSEINRECQALASQLHPIIVQYIQLKVESGNASAFDRTSCTHSNAAYWEHKGEVLTDLNFGGSTKNYGYDEEKPMAYLRVAPISGLNVSVQTFRSVSSALPSFQSSGSQSGENKYGSIRWYDDSERLVASSQIFDNGEVWGVDTACLQSSSDGSVVLIKPVQFQMTISRFLTNTILEVLPRLGYSNTFEVECGVTIANGLHLFQGADYHEHTKQLYRDLQIRRTITRGQTVDFLMDVRRELYRCARLEPPADVHVHERNLYGRFQATLAQRADAVEPAP